jgi:histidinol phosphatase-like PHP family hydrolase
MPKHGQKFVEEVQKCKRLKFDSISLTDESPVDKENSIFEKNIFKIRCLWTQLNFI